MGKIWFKGFDIFEGGFSGKVCHKKRPAQWCSICSAVCSFFPCSSMLCRRTSKPFLVYIMAKTQRDRLTPESRRSLWSPHQCTSNIAGDPLSIYSYALSPFWLYLIPTKLLWECAEVCPKGSKPITLTSSLCDRYGWGKRRNHWLSSWHTRWFLAAFRKSICTWTFATFERMTLYWVALQCWICLHRQIYFPTTVWFGRG